MFNKPMCYDCVHFDEEAEYSTTKPSPRCAAFDHIPADIFLSQFDHRNATEGDNGIQFEPKKGKFANRSHSHFLLGSPDAPVPPGFNPDGTPQAPPDPRADY